MYLPTRILLNHTICLIFCKFTWFKINSYSDNQMIINIINIITIVMQNKNVF